MGFAAYKKNRMKRNLNKVRVSSWLGLIHPCEANEHTDFFYL